MQSKHHSKGYSHYVLKIVDNPVPINIGMWAVIYFLLALLSSLGGNWPFSFYLLNMLVAIPAMLLFSYGFGYWGNKLLFDYRMFLLYFVLFAVSSVLCAVTIPLLNHFVFFEFFYPRVFEPTPWFNWRLIPQNFILIWFPYFIVTIKTFFINWFRVEQEKLIIENKQLLSEIQLMKIKLHPHFLFNTLNNLYSMANKGSKETSEYIMKLSELYRIMLYECNKDFYPVREEISLIKNYIELEKIRYDERLELTYEIPENLESDLMIPPLLFFTFVENSFKHGCRNDVGQPFVHIHISISDDMLIFESENSIPETESKIYEYGGIGLDNTRKRLDLIYENEYVFENKMKDNYYQVSLRIPKLYMS